MWTQTEKMPPNAIFRRGYLEHLGVIFLFDLFFIVFNISKCVGNKKFYFLITCGFVL